MSTHLQSAQHRDCPLCRGSEVIPLKSVRTLQPSSSPLPEQYDLVACPACDFVYADTAASQVCYERYYAKQAKYAATHASGSGEDSTDRLRLEQTANRLLPWLPDRKSPWLDIGCGRGGLLGVMAEQGCTLGLGLDPDGNCVRAAASHGITVRTGTLSQITEVFAGQRFDLVVLSHVLEHVLDLEALEAVVGLLSDSGYLYVEVPDASRYMQFERTPFYYLDSEHINHFGAHALGRLLRRLGLSLQHIEAVDLPLPDGVDYPALALVAGRGGDEALPEAGVVAAMRDYLETSARRCALSVTPALPEQAEILVWGAGSMTQRLLGMGLLDGYRIRCFLDNDPGKQERELAGLRIIAPDEGLARYPGVPIVVCVAIDPQTVASECRRRDVRSGRSIHWLS